MKISNLFISLSILVVVAAGHSPSYANSYADDRSKKEVKESPSPLYIDNVHVVDIKTGQIIENRQLLILNGKIAAIKPAKTAIADKRYTRHYGKGSYVMPGLIDMHVHAFDPAAFTIALSHGVTHLRLMNGVKEHIVWRKELEEGSKIGSTITVSSPTISSFKHAHMHSLAQTPEDAITAVVKAKQQGYDLIKAYGNLTTPVLNALLSEARNQHIPVAKHGPHPTDDMTWNELSGLQSLEHVEDIYQGPLNYTQDQKKLDETIVKLKALNIPITPTLNIFWQLTQISEQKQAFIDAQPKDYISPIIALEETHHQVKRWIDSSAEMTERNKNTLAYLQEITRQLYQAGIPLLVGTDSGELLSPHGLATHREMALMQQAGIPAIAVLRAATINAAKALGKEAQLGQVAVGYNADLIFSEQNPIENLATLEQPAAVVKHGRFLSRTELQQLRKKAIDERSFWQEIKTLSKAGG